MKRLFALALVLATSGCLASVEPLPFEVKLEASKSSFPTGELVDFVVTAQGGTLLAVTIDYGDGNTETFPPSGSRTARITFPHAFDLAGTYLVKATVTESTEGDKSATVQVTVN
jgi:hypothetical protein